MKARFIKESVEDVLKPKENILGEWSRSTLEGVIAGLQKNFNLHIFDYHRKNSLIYALETDNYKTNEEYLIRKFIHENTDFELIKVSNAKQYYTRFHSLPNIYIFEICKKEVLSKVIGDVNEGVENVLKPKSKEQIESDLEYVYDEIANQLIEWYPDKFEDYLETYEFVENHAEEVKELIHSEYSYEQIAHILVNGRYGGDFWDKPDVFD